MPEKIPIDSGRTLLNSNEGSEIEDRKAGEAKKRKEIVEFLEEIENKGGSIYRLGDNSQFYTDPGGIDPISLLPREAKDELLGDFDRRTNFSSYLDYTEDEDLEAVEILKKTRPNPPPDVLHFVSGKIAVEYKSDAIESQLMPFGVNEGLRWRIWTQKDKKHGKLLGIDIESSFSILDEDILDKMVGIYDSSPEEQDIIDFSKDPSKYLANIYEDSGDEPVIAEKEEKFIKHCLKKIEQIRKQYLLDSKAPRFYPGQREESYRGLAVDILARAVEEANKHGYDGMLVTPAYFHSAENFERQGFEFTTVDDIDHMAMLKMALRSVDEKKYKKVLQDALNRGVSEDEAKEATSASALTPQERSWVVLLNSLKSQDLIPTEFNLHKVLLEKLKEVLDDIDQRALEVGRERYETLSRTPALSGEEYEQLRKKTSKKLSPADILRLQDYRTERWIEAIYNRRINLLLEEKKKLERMLYGLQRMSRLEFPSSTDIRELNGVTPNMTLLFERGVQSPEFVQEKLDELIENGIVTGDTLNPPGSYVENCVGKNRVATGYTALYHMYSKNGFVKQEDGLRVERKNIEHFAQIKEEIERNSGLNAKTEMASGNVRNPGPNKTFGWKYEEPAVWNDELLDIERSEQSVLVIDCATLEDLAKIVKYLHKQGYKEKENDTHTDPRWFVPDIRVLGLEEEEYDDLDDNSPVKKFLKPAIMHVKKGEKDGYASTITHHTHRMVSGFTHVPVLIHRAMDDFIRKDEEKLGEYEFVSR